MGKIIIFILAFLFIFFASKKLFDKIPANTAIAVVTPAANTTNPSAVSAASVAAAQSAATTSPCGTSYTVQAGDYLSAIALKCGVTTSALQAANPTIPGPNYFVFPGQVINIPSGSIPNTGGNTYTVVAGDTLFAIALRYNTTVAAFSAANPSITNVNLIYPGQVLNIPNGAGIPNTGGNTYTVVAGDTLYAISRRYNITVAALAAANAAITNVNLIYPGQVLTIP